MLSLKLNVLEIPLDKELVVYLFLLFNQVTPSVTDIDLQLSVIVRTMIVS